MDTPPPHVEYHRTHVIVEIYDELTLALASGKPYTTRLDLPPTDPRVAHRSDEVADTTEAAL